MSRLQAHSPSRPRCACPTLLQVLLPAREEAWRAALGPGGMLYICTGGSCTEMALLLPARSCIHKTPPSTHDRSPSSGRSHSVACTSRRSEQGLAPLVVVQQGRSTNISKTCAVSGGVPHAGSLSVCLIALYIIVRSQVRSEACTTRCTGADSKLCGRVPRSSGRELRVTS